MEVMITIGMTLAEVEKTIILATLKCVGFRRDKASKILGIGERTLYAKIKKYKEEQNV